MDIRAEILREHSKKQVIKIADWAGQDASRIKLLVQLLVNDEYRVVQRVAWVISHIADRHPGLIAPHLPLLTKSMAASAAPAAVRRNIVRILQFIKIPPSLQGRVVSSCFDFLADPKETVAVKCFSMTVLARLSAQFPDIRNELQLLIEDQWEHATAGFRARARRILADIKEV